MLARHSDSGIGHSVRVRVRVRSGFIAEDRRHLGLHSRQQVGVTLRFISIRQGALLQPLGGSRMDPSDDYVYYCRLGHNCVTCDITTIHTPIATLHRSGMNTLICVLRNEVEITRDQTEITTEQAEITKTGRYH